jgi:hypothetical protein
VYERNMWHALHTKQVKLGKKTVTLRYESQTSRPSFVVDRAEIFGGTRDVEDLFLYAEKDLVVPGDTDTYYVRNEFLDALSKSTFKAALKRGEIVELGLSEGTTKIPMDNGKPDKKVYVKRVVPGNAVFRFAVVEDRSIRVVLSAGDVDDAENAMRKRNMYDATGRKETIG